MKQFLHFQPVGASFSLPYLVTRPERPAEDKLPMIVFLHGAGERGDDEMSLRVHGIPRYFAENESHLGQSVITLSPQCPTDQWWPTMPEILMELILAVAEKYNADMDRISLTGLSMGGHGSWELLTRYPDFFSAACPICGGGNATDIYTKTPIRAFHGEADDCVPLIYSQRMVNAVNEHGGNATLVTYPNCGHDCWTHTYEQTDIIPWLIAAKKEN